MNNAPQARSGAAGRRLAVDLVLAVLLGSAAFALYVATLAPTLLAGDGGEFQFVPYLAGLAHPTGYPLYCLLGWAWSHLLPFGHVAQRMNLFSAFWAALAVGLLYPTALRLLRQAIPDLSPAFCRPLAILSGGVFALTPTFWSQAVIAEVYTLHLFFVVLLLYLFLRWGEGHNPRLGLLAALGYGLSLTHHRTTLLLIPALAAYVWLVKGIRDKGPGTRQSSTRRSLPLVPCPLLLAACLLPLALYLYIPLRAPHTPYLHLPLAGGRELVLYDNTPAGFIKFVLGGPFGGSVDFSVNFGARLAMAWSFLCGEVGWLGLGLAAFGLLWLVIGRKWALLALTGLLYGATVAFNLVYTIGDIYVLFIPSYLVVVLWLAVGVGALWKICKFTNLQITLLARATVLLGYFVLPVWLAVDHYANVDQSHNTRARDRWESILAAPLPTDAVLVSDDRNDIMPLWYLQYVDGRRPDLLGLFPLITPAYPTLGEILDLALSTGRPVYLIKEMPGVEVKVEVEAEGKLWRAVGPAAREPTYPVHVSLADAVELVGYEQAPGYGQPGGTLQVSLYWQALQPLPARYHTFVHLLDAEGNKVTQHDGQPGGVFYPTTLWRPGERLRDEHPLPIPADTAPGIYHLLAGMYALADDGTLQPLGEPVVIGQVTIAGSDQ